MYKDLNFRFFESFTRLDKLCKEMYNDESKPGVTQYISDMESNQYNCCIPNEYDFNKTLKKLKRLRYIRNRLAHDSGAFQQQMCTEEDLIYIEKFYNDIINQKDPLYKIYQNKKNAMNINNDIPRILLPYSQNKKNAMNINNDIPRILLPYSQNKKTYNETSFFKICYLIFILSLLFLIIYLKATS